MRHAHRNVTLTLALALALAQNLTSSTTPHTTAHSNLLDASLLAVPHVAPTHVGGVEGLGLFAYREAPGHSGRVRVQDRLGNLFLPKVSSVQRIPKAAVWEGSMRAT